MTTVRDHYVPENAVVRGLIGGNCRRPPQMMEMASPSQGCAIMIDRDRSSNDRSLDRSKGSVRRSIVDRSRSTISKRDRERERKREREKVSERERERERERKRER